MNGLLLAKRWRERRNRSLWRKGRRRRIMKEEDKDLLLKDLCGRLPYGVKVKITPINTENFSFDAKIIEINTNGVVGTVNNNNIYCRHDIDEIQPYLFPLSSMTEEQENEWCDACLQPLIKRLDRHIRKEDLMLYA